MQTALHTFKEFNAVNIQQAKNYVGRFTVIHKSGISKFAILDLALRFYNELNEEAAVWDVTNGHELIKSKSI